MVTQKEIDRSCLETAKIWGSLSRAQRNKVGAVLYKNGAIISIGFNGTPSGFDNTCEIEQVDCWHKPIRHNTKGSIYQCVKCGTTLSEKEYREGYRPKVDTTLVTKPEVLHAESNAIAKVAKSTQSCEGATLYVTLSPCMECAKQIIQCGIVRVVYSEEYRITDGIDLLRKAGIDVELHQETKVY
jgi:dCMP deaminase